MAKDYLPLKLDPLRFADNGMHLQGSLPIQDMPRLLPSLAENNGQAHLTADFGVDEEGIRFLRGRVIAQLSLQCQRCLEPFNYEVMSDFRLGIVQTDAEGDELPSHYDPLVLKEPQLFIQDIVEDELIVSLPIVAMHQAADCKVTLPLAAMSAEMSEEERNNPFKVVELLRTKRDEK